MKYSCVAIAFALVPVLGASPPPESRPATQPATQPVTELTALLKKRASCDPEQLPALEKKLNLLRARICIAATREAIRIDIERTKEGVGTYHNDVEKIIFYDG